MNPLEERSEGVAGDLGESALIDRIRTWLGEASPPSPRGIGDDCAVFDLTPGRSGLVTTDPILWQRHFDNSISPAQAAEKLVKRNVSDIAAMGGTPLSAVVSLLLPADTSLLWLRLFHEALGHSALRHGLVLAGGDIAQTDGLLAASMTLIGETCEERPLTRAGASVGDWLAVTGELGGSILGHHHSFEPRIAHGGWLCRRPEVKAAMDVSDGLAKDLPALLPPRAWAELCASAIPVSAAAREMARKSGRPALAHALGDGEDYELVFAVEGGADLDRFRSDWHRAFPDVPLSIIGRIHAPDGSGPRLRGLPDEVLKNLRGYEHLGKD
jgi:thiamine-monophosphate kinase